jgi:hypothetical protein
MSGGLGALTQAWVMAEASRPLGWKVTGLLAHRWGRVAGDSERADEGQRAEGRGGYPEQALRRLGEELARLRGSANGSAKIGAAEYHDN